jgi:phosphatidylethanolamine-binding protein (PEBP) family uncharacterized protein
MLKSSVGYDSPNPPPGKPHRYFFKLYALDRMLDLKPGLTKQQLLKAMDGHVPAKRQLVGTYLQLEVRRGHFA